MSVIFKKEDGTTVEFRKFNPYHDSRGRFSSANSASSFTFSPGKSKAHDKAIATAKIQNNPYRYYTDDKLKSERDRIVAESKKAQLRASLSPSKATNKVIAAAKKKIKELDEKYRQVQDMLDYSEKYGNDNTF